MVLKLKFLNQNNMTLGLILSLLGAFMLGILAGAFLICLLISNKLPPPPNW
jgi:hypothetical protein